MGPGTNHFPVECKSSLHRSGVFLSRVILPVAPTAAAVAVVGYMGLRTEVYMARLIGILGWVFGGFGVRVF
jgi:hypothetical protein